MEANYDFVTSVELYYPAPWRRIPFEKLAKEFPAFCRDPSFIDVIKSEIPPIASVQKPINQFRVFWYNFFRIYCKIGV